MQAKHTEALRIVTKLANEYLSTKESLQLIVELAKLGDEARAAVEGREAKVAEIEREIVRLTSSASTFAQSESRARERAEAASRDAGEKEARVADLDVLLAQRSEALANIAASIEAHKKVLAQV